MERIAENDGIKRRNGEHRSVTASASNAAD
jgi:hypothetical protein